MEIEAGVQHDGSWRRDAGSTEIHAYIARHSSRYAGLTVERLLDALERVADFPESGRIVPELAEPAIREVIHGAFRIIYELREDRAEVLTVSGLPENSRAICGAASSAPARQLTGRCT